MKSLFDYANLDEKRFQDMKNNIAKRNFRPVNDYLFLVKQYSQKSITCFSKLEKAQYVVLCDKTEQGIEVKRAQAKSKKTKTQAIGGTAAGVALAGGVTTGVAVSIIAGVFMITFGVGTV